MQYRQPRKLPVHEQELLAIYVLSRNGDPALGMGNFVYTDPDPETCDTQKYLSLRQLRWQTLVEYI